MSTALKARIKILSCLLMACPSAGLAELVFANSSNNSLTTTKYVKASEAGDLPIQIGAGLSAGQLLYREEKLVSQRFYSFNLNVGYKISEYTSLSLSQRIDYSPEQASSSVLIREEDDKIQLGTTSLGLKQTLLQAFDDKVYLNAGIGAGWYHSEYYADLTRIASGTVNLKLGFDPTAWIGYEISPSYTYYHHKDTLAYTGEANDKQSFSLGHILELRTPEKEFKFGLSYANYLYERHENAEDVYFYRTSARFDWIPNEQISFFTFISTLSSQIANDSIAAVVLTNKDVTYISGGMDYKFF